MGIGYAEARMLVGAIVDALAVLLGGIGGAAIGGRLPERLKSGLPSVFGVASMAMGVVLIVKVDTLGVMVISLLLGSVVGELAYVEKGIGAAASGLNAAIGRFLPRPARLSHDEFLEKYVAIVVLFCASGTGIFGALHEGMTGDPSILIAKASLDVLTAAIFATSLGFAVALVSLPQIIILLGLELGAAFIEPLMSGGAEGNFAAVGGVLMLATGFRISGITNFPIANMLPALIFVIPVTTLWGLVF